MVFGLAAAFPCSREAGAIDELNKHAVRGTWMQERNETFDAPARRRVHKLDALRGQANERARKVIDDETEMVQRGATALGDEPRHARLRVGRLEQLDARAVPCREGDADTLVGDQTRLVDAVAQQVAIERDGLGERRHRDGDVMQLAGADPLHERGG